MASKSGIGVLDITSSEFDVDAYMSRILKERGLDDLVKEEEQMVTAVSRYSNPNKNTAIL